MRLSWAKGLALVGAALILCIGWCWGADVAAQEAFGAEANPTGDPVGGGPGYRAAVTEAAHRAATKAELLTALEQAVAGEVIFVQGAAEIDLTGEKSLVIPGGVTLASDRGRNGSAGALLFTNQLETMPLFATGGENVRVTGLRLRGPDQERRESAYVVPNSRGIQAAHPRLEVDNCELWGWSHAAILLTKGATPAHVHHNYIHHNQRSGLGYGVCLSEGEALIEANTFDWCRHAIAGTGAPGTSYEARYNLVLENASSHSFDMHGGADRKDGTDIAGDRILIHHNTFKAVSVPAVVIRGRPTEKAEIHHNWFLHTDAARAVVQTNATGNMQVYRNQFGPERVIR